MGEGLWSSTKSNAVIINETASFFISWSTRSSGASLTLSQCASLTHQVLNQSDCNQASMLKGQRPSICGIGTAAKGSFGALHSQIDVVQCRATVHSVKHLSPIWMAILKP